MITRNLYIYNKGGLGEMADRIARITLVARAVVGMSLRWVVVALSADLLYLYYTGCWYDPNPVIETTEVVLLYCLAVAGMVWLVIRFRQFQKEYSDAY